MATYPVIMDQLVNAGLSPTIATILFVAVLVWALAWKGVALWRSARNGQKGWFVWMLILQTLGILEIIYLLTAGKERRHRR